jgi:curli biogenesis system outer membrane secretion channel CsgG
MDDSTGILIAAVVGVLLVAAVLLFLIPEPSQRAVIADERLDVAVLAFTNSSSWPSVGETLAGRIETKLVNADGIDVYSRVQLDALLMEHTLSAAGFLDPTTAVEIGSLTGVNKLITGSVYAVDTGSRKTEICTRWVDGACVEEVPGTEYTARIRAEIEVVDARTGLIERALDLTASDATTLREGSFFGGFDSLLASAATTIAGEVEGALTAAYTREFRYGLYVSVEPKRNGYVGEEEASRFSSTEDTVHLIAHFTRIGRRESFDLVWVDPDGAEVSRIEDVVSQGEWRHYTLDPYGLPSGRYSVTGILGGVEAFDEPFTILP